ncbi:TrbC/VirB2 family protein [Xanthomonas euvesicatoria]|uniref:TrbC/VirB2 family protein n=1 Tax=Xanthomonas euvesicatoria TaxID=456327 RepID=UPI001C48F0CD|nr:TrbC/VirB2 family protein [Xanthomonas euvesicatoria]MBV6851724.1 TrbC/VirB2 family protein [Xanthomonas campestris pv. heliotropii]
MKGTPAHFADYKTAVASSLLLAIVAADADAQGLAKAKGFLNSLKDNLLSFVPIIAICAGLVLVILYWFNVIQKEGFIKWIVGLIIAGSVAEIVALFVT